MEVLSLPLDSIIIIKINIKYTWEILSIAMKQFGFTIYLLIFNIFRSMFFNAAKYSEKVFYHQQTASFDCTVEDSCAYYIPPVCVV